MSQSISKLDWLTPVIITKCALRFPAACDSARIISGISLFSFSASVKISTSLNNLGKTASLAPPVTVVVFVVLDGVTVLVVAVELNLYFYEFVTEIVYLEQKRSELYLLFHK